MKFDGYIRISRKGSRGGESFLSPAIQRDTIKRLTQAKGLELGEIVEEIDVSGSKPIEQRPLGQLIERVERGDSGGVIVWKLSRFSRSLSDAVEATARITAAGGRLIAEDFDSAQPMGKALLGLLAGLAEEELDQRRAGWDEAQGRAVGRGVHIASRVPTGYQRREGKGEDKRLEPNPKSAPVIAELFRRRASGQGWTALAQFLSEAGVVSPYGNRNWYPSAVQKLIRNRVYLGEARSGRHSNAQAHEPIVSRSEWQAAQSRVAVESVRKGEGQLLTGLVRCAGCRYLMKPDHMRARDGGRLGLYRCRVSHASGHCESPASVLARVVDPLVEQLFLAAIGPEGPMAEEIADGGVELQQVEQALGEAEQELVAFRDEPMLMTTLGRDRFLAGIEARVRGVQDAQDALDALSPIRSTIPLTSELIEEWPSLAIPQRRHLLVASLDAVMVRSVRSAESNGISDRVHLIWAGQAPDDLPRRGRRVPLASFLWPDEAEALAGVALGEHG